MYLPLSRCLYASIGCSFWECRRTSLRLDELRDAECTLQRASFVVSYTDIESAWLDQYLGLHGGRWALVELRHLGLRSRRWALLELPPKASFFSAVRQGASHASARARTLLANRMVKCSSCFEELSYVAWPLQFCGLCAN